MPTIVCNSVVPLAQAEPADATRVAGTDELTEEFDTLLEGDHSSEHSKPKSIVPVELSVEPRPEPDEDELSDVVDIAIAAAILKMDRTSPLRADAPLSGFDDAAVAEILTAPFESPAASGDADTAAGEEVTNEELSTDEDIAALQADADVEEGGDPEAVPELEGEVATSGPDEPERNATVALRPEDLRDAATRAAADRQLGDAPVVTMHAPRTPARKSISPERADKAAPIPVEAQPFLSARRTPSEMRDVRSLSQSDLQTVTARVVRSMSSTDGGSFAAGADSTPFAVWKEVTATRGAADATIQPSQLEHRLNQTEFLDAVLRQGRLLTRPDGAREIRLRLDPPDLGDVELRLTLRKDRLHAVVRVENAAAREAIETLLPRVRQLLAGDGMRLENFEVDLRQRPDAQDGRGDGQSASGRDGSQDGSDFAADEEDAVSSRRECAVVSLGANAMDFVA